MRLPPRLKTRLDSLIKTRLSGVVERHFRRNEGATDYAQFAAPITLTGDFVIEFDLLVNTGGTYVLLGDLNSQDDFIAVFSDGRIQAKVDGSKSESPARSIALNVLQTITVTRVADVVTTRVGGVVTASDGLMTGTFLFDALCRNQSGFYLPGILANLKIWDDGVLVTDCPIDESSGATIFDTVGGNNATIINGLDVDRGKFIEQPTLWKGENLTVPPWDSVDQELLKS